MTNVASHYVLIYMILSVFGLGFATTIWSRDGFLNIFIKMGFGAATLFGTMIIAKDFM
jgi:hypothetical protein